MAMLDIDVDEIREVNYLDATTSGEQNAVLITFKNGETRVYKGAEFGKALEILKHWTPPTA
jgi:hypothetical protein